MVSIVSQVDTSHDDMIHDAQMDFYGTRLATCSSDRTVKIFEIQNGSHKLLATLNGHEGPVWQLCWAHPKFSNLLASCSYDKKVIIWKEVSLNHWEKVYEHNNHDSSVNSVCWSPQHFGLMLTCGSSDGAISVISSQGDGIWDSKKISNAHSIGCNAVSWAPALAQHNSQTEPNSKQLVKRFVSGGCDNLVKIWRYDDTDEKWIEEQKLEAHSDWVRDVGWAPSIGLPKSYIASCSQDRRVIIWTNTMDGPNSNNWSYKILHTFDDVVWHVSWSIMGNILAVSGGDNKVSLWKENFDSNWICISDMTGRMRK